MKIITGTGFKGGAGESIITIHLAAYFSQNGSTLLVDGDSNNTSVAWANRGSLHWEVLTSHQSLKPVGGSGWGIF